MRYAITLTLLLLAVPIASAQQTWNDGYNYFFSGDSTAYRAVYTWVAPCTTCGAYRAGYWSGPTYVAQAKPAVSTITQTINNYAAKKITFEDARFKIITEGETRRTRTVEHAQLLDLAATYDPTVLAPGTLRTSNAALLQGQTVYASYKSANGSYGILDPNQPLQQAHLQILSATELLKTGLSGFQSIVGDINSGVKAQTQQTVTVQTASGPVAPTMSPVAPVAPASLVTAPVPAVPEGVLSQAEYLRLDGPASCVACHGAGAPHQRRFDITSFHPATASQPLRDAVLRYITEGPPGGCPKKVRLTDAQRLQFVTVPRRMDGAKD